MRRGLVFGKYKPFHRGHQFIVDRAFAECDDVVIVIYDSPTAEDVFLPMPLAKRVAWIEMLYPQAETILAVKDPVAGKESDGPEYAKVYADQLRPIGQIDRVYTSEPQYQDFCDLLGATHVIVDADRVSVPTSGTEIRSNLFEYRGWVDPRIYRTLIQKVVFVGTESTGKSTLARAMAEELGTTWVHEYGRELWESKDLKGTFADHWQMAQRQYEREQRMAVHANRFLFCDTNPWTTLMWSLNTYGVADQRLHDLVDRTAHEYTWVFCENDFDFVQDGTRELVDGKAEAFQDFQHADLKDRGISFTTVRGAPESRVEQVKRALVPKQAVYTGGDF